MKNITTYSARRSNIFVWLTVLLMLASAVTRIIWLSKTDESGLFFAVVFGVLPLAANLLIALRLPLRGEKYFYVTVRPVICITVCFFVRIFRVSANIERSGWPFIFVILSALLCAFQGFLYYKTFSGKVKTKLWVLLLYAAGIAAAIADRNTRAIVPAAFEYGEFEVLSDIAMALGIITMILSAKRLPDPVEGEPYRFRYGDRMDGRLVRGGIPLDKVSPYIMVTRNTADNMLKDSIDVTGMERYIHKKRREGLKHFGITHVIIASYMRTCAEFPGLMRFLSGQKVYQRMKVTMKMVVKKELKIGAPETIISVDLLPSDTADDVYRKFDEQIQIANKSDELDSGFDNLAKLINYIPGLALKFVVWLLKTMDYLGILPIELMELSPFHGSLFITSMGSLGIPPIFHHLYDFGNIPVFIAFGAKRTEYGVDSEGNVVRNKYLDYSGVIDERIVDGQYYASAFKKLRSLMQHPDQLDEAPEVVKEDID